jgi:hypothetical protein
MGIIRMVDSICFERNTNFSIALLVIYAILMILYIWKKKVRNILIQICILLLSIDLLYNFSVFLQNDFNDYSKKECYLFGFINGLKVMFYVRLNNRFLMEMSIFLILSLY